MLEIDGLRGFACESVYFDTPDLLTYRAHRQGRRHRYKIATCGSSPTLCRTGSTRPKTLGRFTRFVRSQPYVVAWRAFERIEYCLLLCMFGGPMTRYILHAAAACGGYARGFDQGKDTTTCTVYVADWLTGRATGTDRVFLRSEPQPSSLQSTLRSTPVGYVAGEARKVEGRYEVSAVVEGAHGPVVWVTVHDHRPDDGYRKEATDLKTQWGSMGFALQVRAGTYLLERSQLKRTTGRDRHFAPATEDGAADLLGYLKEPGFTWWAVQGTSGHAIASQTTSSEFWYFDPLVGELSLPGEQLEAWFATEFARTYFKKFTYLTATPLERA